MKIEAHLGLAFAAVLAACSSADPQPATAPTEGTEAAAAEPQAEHGDHGDHGDHGEHAEASNAPQPVRELEDGARVYGSEPSDREVTALADIAAEPARFSGQVVKTEGTVAQVCQRMGCWMELQAAEGSQAVRVPMAGHSFFLPRDIAGRRATVEGTVEVSELDEATQEHLREEGAEAADQALAIEATAVVVH